MERWAWQAEPALSCSQSREDGAGWVFVSYYIPKGNPQSSLTYYPRDNVSKEPKHLSK